MSVLCNSENVNDIDSQEPGYTTVCGAVRTPLSDDRSDNDC